jgi:hypothetical protein
VILAVAETVSTFWFLLTFIGVIAFIGACVLNMPETQFGKEVHDRLPRLYRLLTGTDEWRGDDDDHLWRGGPEGSV